MEVTPQNIQILFGSRFIPDGTVLYVHKNRTGNVIKGEVIDCRVYLDSFLILLGYEKARPDRTGDTTEERATSFDYPSDKFTVLMPLKKLAASVVYNTNPDALYHTDNPFFKPI